MKIFLITTIITCLTLVLVGLLVNFCRRRLAKTPHGLSGMCHQKGGAICSSCADQTVTKEKKVDDNKR